MTSSEYALQVREPYKWLIPDDLEEEIINHFLQARKVTRTILVTPRRRCLSSKLLLNEQSEYISRLILEHESSASGILPDFQILFQAQQNGWDKFHQACKGKEKTLVVIKIQNGSILGGYNPLTWDLEQQSPTNENSQDSVRVAPPISVATNGGPFFARHHHYRRNRNQARSSYASVSQDPQISSLPPQFEFINIAESFNRTSNSFIFQFSSDGIFRKARVVDPSFAIDTRVMGPKFGRNDLCVEGRRISLSTTDYEQLTFDGIHDITDYEVHQVRLVD